MDNFPNKEEFELGLEANYFEGIAMHDKIIWRNGRLYKVEGSDVPRWFSGRSRGGDDENQIAEIIHEGYAVMRANGLTSLYADDGARWIELHSSEKITDAISEATRAFRTEAAMDQMGTGAHD